MSKKFDLIRNTGIIAVGKISTQFLTLLLLPLYTAFLPPADFGQLDLIMVYLAVLAPTFTVQMEMAVFRHLLDVRDKPSKITEVVSSSSMVLVLGVIAGSVVIWGFGAIASVENITILIALFASLALVNFLLQVSRGIGRNGLYSVASLFIGFSNVSGSIVLVVLLEKGLLGVLLAGVIANSVGVVFLVVALRFPRMINLHSVNKTIIKLLVTYSWPLVPNHISIWGINGISRTIVVMTLGLAATGVFAAAARFPLIYTALYGIFSMSWTEAAALHVKDRNDSFFSEVTDSAIRFFGSLCILIIAVVSLGFPLLVASDFSEARKYIPILVTGAFLGSIVSHYGAIYLAVKQTKQVALITLQAVVMTGLLTLSLINIIGLYAPSIALVVTYLFLAFRRHRKIQRFVTIKYRKSTFVWLMTIGILVVTLYHFDSVATSICSIFIALIGVFVLNKRSLVQGLKYYSGKRKLRALPELE